MKYLLFTIFCYLSLLSCNKNKTDLPIERDKLIAILMDVHLAEAAMQETTLENKDSLGKLYYQKIFNLYGVTEAEFNKSMFLIRQNPKELDAIYKEVIETMDKKETEIRKMPSKPIQPQ